jgi:mRNA-degrading endonuclease RelE of RelBE toxin-antitoxin system
VPRTWRVRITIDGVPWRLVYQVDDEHRRVRILRIVRRDEGTYRNLRDG